MRTIENCSGTKSAGKSFFGIDELEDAYICISNARAILWNSRQEMKNADGNYHCQPFITPKYRFKVTNNHLVHESLNKSLYIIILILFARYRVEYPDFTVFDLLFSEECSDVQFETRRNLLATRTRKRFSDAEGLKTLFGAISGTSKQTVVTRAKSDIKHTDLHVQNRILAPHERFDWYGDENRASSTKGILQNPPPHG